MQFLIIAYDGTDSEALSRRMAVRERHIALSNEAIKSNKQLFGTAILNEAGNMCGSVMVVDYPSREALDEWLLIEPYVTGNVWQKIEIHPTKIGPSFEHLFGLNNEK